MPFSNSESFPWNFSFFQAPPKDLLKPKTKNATSEAIALYKGAKLEEAKEITKNFLSTSSPKEQKELFLTFSRSGLLHQVLLDLPRSLTSLDLSGCSDLSDTVLIAVAGRVPCLKHINFSGCDLLSDEAIATFLRSIPGLRTANLAGCYLTSSTTLEALAETATALTSLTLDGCYDIQDKDLTLLAEELVNLKYLSLLECSQVSYKGMDLFEDASIRI